MKGSNLLQSMLQLIFKDQKVGQFVWALSLFNLPCMVNTIFIIVEWQLLAINSQSLVLYSFLNLFFCYEVNKSLIGGRNLENVAFEKMVLKTILIFLLMYPDWPKRVIFWQTLSEFLEIVVCCGEEIWSKQKLHAHW